VGAWIPSATVLACVPFFTTERKAVLEGFNCFDGTYRGTEGNTGDCSSTIGDKGVAWIAACGVDWMVGSWDEDEDENGGRVDVEGPGLA